MHGGKTAFGTVARLMLDAGQDKACEIVDFMAGAGPPVTFAGLSLNSVSKEHILAWCEANTRPAASTTNHSFAVSAKTLYSAMIAAGAFGAIRKQAPKWILAEPSKAPFMRALLDFWRHAALL